MVSGLSRHPQTCCLDRVLHDILLPGLVGILRYVTDVASILYA